MSSSIFRRMLKIGDAVASLLGTLITIYMVYATIFGPYKTGLVHLSIFASAMFGIFFLNQGEKESIRSFRSLVRWGFAIASVAAFSYIIFDFERLINLWGSSYLTEIDMIVGISLIIIILEAVRRQSYALFVLALLSIVYMLWGAWFPGAFSHAGMNLRRLVYLNVYTSEGVFGVGLSVAAGYLFMFMLLGSALQATRTGDFIMNIATATVGRQTGGAAKTAMITSAGLGTVVGSSVGNVVATGTFTIPMMIRTGFKPHVAAAVETNTSEGAQLVPPILGAAAFIMAQITGIPYATIAIAAILPALLYYFSLFWVIHIEALRAGAHALPAEEIPSWRDALRDGWHLGISPILLFYLLIVENYTPAYASLVAIGVALAVGLLRSWSRLPLRQILSHFDAGVKQAASITALIAAIGLLQAGVITTGLGNRIAEIILALSDGTLFLTAVWTVVTAVIIGAGMPTPIAYLLLALVAAPALELAGATKLSAHLFVFYFAIKSGSIPPIAVVATVAASIAKANWFRTAVTATIQSLPNFIVAFMFLYSPALLMQGDGGVISIALTLVSSCVGIFALACAMYGWCIFWINWPKRVVLATGAFALIDPGAVTDVIGIALVGAFLLYQFLGEKNSNQKKEITNVQ